MIRNLKTKTKHKTRLNRTNVVLTHLKKKYSAYYAKDSHRNCGFGAKLKQERDEKTRNK